MGHSVRPEQNFDPLRRMMVNQENELQSQEAETEVKLFGKWAVTPSTKNWIMLAVGMIAMIGITLGVMAFYSGLGMMFVVSPISLGVVFALVLLAVHFLSTDEGVASERQPRKGQIMHCNYSHEQSISDLTFTSSYPTKEEEEEEGEVPTQAEYLNHCREIGFENAWCNTEGTFLDAGNDLDNHKKIYEKSTVFPNSYTAFPGIAARKKQENKKYVLQMADVKLAISVPSHFHKNQLPNEIKDCLDNAGVNNMTMQLVIHDGTKLPKGTDGMNSRSLFYHGVAYRNSVSRKDFPFRSSRTIQAGIFQPQGVKTIGDQECFNTKRVGIDQTKIQKLLVKDRPPISSDKGKKSKSSFIIPEYNCQFTGSKDSVSSFYAVAIVDEKEEGSKSANVTYSIVINSLDEGTPGNTLMQALDCNNASLLDFMSALEKAADKNLFDRSTLARMQLFLSIPSANKDELFEEV
ncbi:MAG: hypothetical protein KDK55_07120 [Chlamydiia bacterium]|nr:hypothetical protein [Chlamydiia bacterium]